MPKMIPKSQIDYWSRRDSLFNSNLNDIDEELAARYRKCYEELNRDLQLLYAEIEDNSREGIVLVSDLYKFNKYYDMMNTLQNNLIALGLFEEKTIEKYLTNFYLSNMELTRNELGAKWDLINIDKVKSIIRTDWVGDGKNWSNRIWVNRTDLAKRVEDSLIACVVQGKSSAQIARVLAEDFDVSYSMAHRLAATELSYVQNKSTLDSYERSGFKKYRVYHGPKVTKKVKTKNGFKDQSFCCDNCLNGDGKTYFITEAKVGVNFPPFHPNCHCCILAAE